MKILLSKEYSLIFFLSLSSSSPEPYILSSHLYLKLVLLKISIILENAFCVVSLPALINFILLIFFAQV